MISSGCVQGTPTRGLGGLRGCLLGVGRERGEQSSLLVATPKGQSRQSNQYATTSHESCLRVKTSE